MPLKKISAATKHLPDEENRLFVYRKVEDHTVGDTAKRFELRLGTANGRIRRARQAVRRDRRRKRGP